MQPRTRKILIIVGVLVAAYFAYRWYSNRSDNSIQGNAGSGTSLGTNLNSAAPALTDAASGDNSAPQYTSGNESVTIDLPNGDQSTSGGNATGDTDNPPAKGGGPPPKPKPKPIPKPRQKLPVKPKKPVRKPIPVRR